MQNLQKNSIKKISAFFKINLFIQLDKATIKPLLSARRYGCFIRPCSDFTMRGIPINLFIYDYWAVSTAGVPRNGVICSGARMVKTKSYRQ